MNNIVNVAQISLAVIQYSVAAALVGAAAFSAWTTRIPHACRHEGKVAVQGTLRLCTISQSFCFVPKADSCSAA
jgi:hypothetical protein